MLSGLYQEPGFQVGFVLAQAAETGRLAIADIVADHRLASPDAAMRAVRALPGCSVYLARDGSGGYLAFLRGERRVPIRSPQRHGIVPSVAAEVCAVVLYARICTGQVPSAVIVVSAEPRAWCARRRPQERSAR